ncbi:MAG: phage major capsid protein [Rubrivivax sp.]
MSIQEKRERLQALSRKMNHQLAEKGEQKWSEEDQKVFDADSDEAERLQQSIAREQRVLDLDAEKSFADAGRKSKDSPKDAAREGFEIWLRKGHGDRHTPLTAEERQKVLNTMSTTTGSEGGFTVQSAVAKMLIDLLKSYNYMRRVASQITTEQGNPLSYPSSDGTSETGEWIAQNTTATAADPVFGTVALNVFKASSKIIAVPIELLQDSQIDIEAMVMKRARDRIGRIANTGYTVGNGTTAPNGLITAAGTGKVGTAGQTTTVIYDDLVDLVDSLDAAYLDVPASDPEMASGTSVPSVGGGPEPGWMFAQTTRRVVRKIKDTAGRPTWMPSYDEGLTSRTPDRLLGYPVYINNDVAAMAANAKSIAFGNFKNYMIRDAMDVTMFRFDDSAYMKLGQVGFLAWARTGGNLLDVNSVKLYQNSAT